MSHIILNKNSYKKQKVNKVMKSINGFDTETVNGKVFILGMYDEYDNFKYMRINNFDDILSFCIKLELWHYNNFFWNLEYDTNALIKHLPVEYLRQLAEENETMYKGFQIKIIPKKVLIIKYGYKKIRFFDIMQFYNHITLKKAAKNILKKDKIDLDVKNLSIEKFDNDINYKEELLKYFKVDCELCLKLAVHFINVTKNFLLPKNFYSHASLSQQYFLENTPREMYLPPYSVSQFALNSYFGGRFEVMQKGMYDKVRTYDIRSAYPKVNADIPALDKGKWIRSDKKEHNALISLYKIRVEGVSKISPLKYENKQNIIFPTGRIVTYVNKQELKTIELYNYKYKILDGYHYYDKKPEYPFKFLEKFFYEKERLGKKHNNYMFYKIIINGFYGKTIQLNKHYEIDDVGKEPIENIFVKDGKLKYVNTMFKAGVLFNPVVAQEITGNTKSMLLNAVVDQQDSVISFATDSIMTRKRPNIKIGHKLGEWNDETPKNNPKFTVIGSGVYFYENSKTRFRGFGKQLNISNMTNIWLYNYMDKMMPINILKSQKLKQTFKRKELDLNNFNVISNDIKELNINFDRKRLWNDKFNNLDEIYTKQIDSKPLIIKQ